MQPQATLRDSVQVHVFCKGSLRCISDRTPCNAVQFGVIATALVSTGESRGGFHFEGKESQARARGGGIVPVDGMKLASVGLYLSILLCFCNPALKFFPSPSQTPFALWQCADI